MGKNGRASTKYLKIKFVARKSITVGWVERQRNPTLYLSFNNKYNVGLRRKFRLFIKHQILLVRLHPTYSLKFSKNSAVRYYNSTAPNAFNVLNCASVKPVTPVIFIPSYGRATLNIFRHSPVFKSHNLIVSS